MLQDYVKKISDTVDEGRLLRSVQEIACFHRIQASPGFRAAANHCCAKLRGQGMDAEVLSFPANEDTVFDTYPSFQEWSCRQAWCELSTGRRIADFEREPISIIQKSIPCDYRDNPLPIVWLDRGSDPSAYGDADFTGKLVFVRDDFNNYFWAVEDRHAAGFLTDYVLETEGSRARYDQLDTLRYTSFWWSAGMPKCFGFVLSPREGDRLARTLTEAAAKGETVTASCYIDASLYDGALEDVTALLPGSTDEEVLLTAHLCHPRASANDNASGSAAAMEAIRVIRGLTQSGVLPPLKRGIRILLVPEFTGSYAYLERIGAARSRIVAAMNLDMVGGKQDGGYGPLTITDLPRAAASNVCDLAEFLLGEVRREVPSLTGEKLPMFNSYVESFTGGSDHIIFSDPQVGIPSLMLGQWPDKFYHTSSDTVDRIDTHLLARSCTLAASYAYALANLAPEDLTPLFSCASMRLIRDLEHVTLAHAQGTLTDDRFTAKVCRRLDYAHASAQDTLRFFSGEDASRAAAAVDQAIARFYAVAQSLTGLSSDILQNGWCVPDPDRFPDCAQDGITLDAIPKRVYTTLPQLNKSAHTLPDDQRAALEQCRKELIPALGPSGLTMLFYYMDGTRTLREISALLDIDMDTFAPEAVVKTCAALRTLGYVRF